MDPPARQCAEERRRNLIALAIGLGIVALVVAFCARPAYVLGVGPGAVAGSLEGKARISSAASYPSPDDRAANCEGFGEDRYQCRLALEFASGDPLRAIYRVEARSSGCWQARRTGGSEDLASALAGCVWILNY